MKIVTKTLEGIADIQIYPIIGLLIFFSFFVLLIIHVIRISSQEIEEYSNLPLDENDHQSESSEPNLKNY
jgi:cytochrome c oxidase cbb3-type subunit 4